MFEPKLLQLYLILGEKLIEQVILLAYFKVLPVVHVGDAFPNELAIVDHAHDVTDLVEVVLALENHAPLLILISRSLALLKHLNAALLRLLHFEPLARDLVLLLPQAILAALLCRLLLEVAVMVLALVLLHDLIATL